MLRPIAPNPRQERLHELVAPYFDPAELRLAIADGRDIREMLRYEHPLPLAIEQMMETLRLILTPKTYEKIRSPKDVAAMLMFEMGSLMQEQFRVLCLDTKNHVTAMHTVYQGTLNSSHIRIAEVLEMPIHHHSASVIFAHNHPSNDPTPSPEDVLVTRQLVDACRLYDIEPLDHIVVCQDRYVSMRERGLGFDRP